MSSGLTVAAEVRLPGFTLDARFAVPPGLTVLFGPSGAGKSLALQAIAGLVPLSGGAITLNKRALANAARGIALPPRLRGVGYVPQSYALFPHLTVAGNIAYALPGPRHPWDRETRAARAARVAALLALVRLPGFEGRWPRQLSGGQQQRVALGRALAADPEALLLDEPLAALDAPTRAAVQDDLRAVILASGIPALVVTHDLAEARALADRLVVLVAGRVVAEGPLAEVLAAPPTSDAALLLGWRNALPIARADRDGACLRIVLPCGQALSLLASQGMRDAGNQSTLALHADLIEIRSVGDHPERPPDAPTEAGQAALDGTLRSVTDAGAFYLLRVALTGAADDTGLVSVTCSRREWAALHASPGDPVALSIPAGAARLVSCGADAGTAQEAVHE